MKYLLFVLVFFTGLSHAFSTQLSNKLAISAIQCQENETTVEGYICRPGEWLMAVDYTGRENPLLTVRLKKIKVDYYDNSYFSMIPTIPVSPETRWILRRHQVRFTLGGEGEVVLNEKVER